MRPMAHRRSGRRLRQAIPRCKILGPFRTTEPHFYVPEFPRGVVGSDRSDTLSPPRAPVPRVRRAGTPVSLGRRADPIDLCSGSHMPNLTTLCLPRNAVIVAVLILSGCGVIDRGVFWVLTGESPATAAEKDAEASAKTRTPPDGPILGPDERGAPNGAKGLGDRRTPLIVIPFDQPRADYQQALSDLVGRILEYDPMATFELVTVVPGAPDPERAESASGESRHAAEGVLITLIAAGLAADRVGLSARSDPEITRSELHLYRR